MWKFRRISYYIVHFPWLFIFKNALFTFKLLKWILPINSPSWTAQNPNGTFFFPSFYYTISLFPSALLCCVCVSILLNIFFINIWTHFFIILLHYLVILDYSKKFFFLFCSLGCNNIMLFSFVLSMSYIYAEMN